MQLKHSHRGKAIDRLADPRVFALKIEDKNLEPLYYEGGWIILSPAERPCGGNHTLCA